MEQRHRDLEAAETACQQAQERVSALRSAGFTVEAEGAAASLRLAGRYLGKIRARLYCSQCHQPLAEGEGVSHYKALRHGSCPPGASAE